jgi:sulfite reductase (NADPH) flavoprotein alpha-component
MPCDRNNPFRAKLKARARISGPGSDKDVWHIIFDVGGGGVSYGCGDSVAVMPGNDTSAVAEILDRLGVGGDVQVSAGPGGEISIFSALVERFCIEHLPPKFFQWFASVAECGSGAAEELAAVAGACSLVEILGRYRLVRAVGADELLQNLRKLTPRMYSIASSPLVHPDEIHIVINAISYVDAFGTRRHGVASRYLAKTMEVGVDGADIFVVRSAFSPPEDASVPMIMIGPGTGVAPFRGFLQERQWLKNSGVRIGDSWLFFGDRHCSCDFLFRDEIFGFMDAGVLTKLDLAFSRDQASKIYVQDKILGNREEIWRWIGGGAHIYVCGNAAHMAVDVDNALVKVAQVAGGLGEAEAAALFKELRRNKRYQRDVY